MVASMVRARRPGGSRVPPRITPRARHRAFGDTVAWHQWYAVPEEVYLWRASVTGGAFEHPGDAQRMLRSAALGASGLDLDVRGIVISPTGTVTVVFTADSTTPYVDPTTADELADHIAADPTVRERFPQLAIASPRWLQLTGPPASVDFWKAHATVWDDVVGPLDAFAKGEGVYRGPDADAGPALEPWKADKPDLGGGKDDKAKVPNWTNRAVLAGAGVLALAGAWALMSRKAAA